MTHAPLFRTCKSGAHAVFSCRYLQVFNIAYRAQAGIAVRRIQIFVENYQRLALPQKNVASPDFANRGRLAGKSAYFSLRRRLRMSSVRGSIWRIFHWCVMPWVG